MQCNAMYGMAWIAGCCWKRSMVCMHSMDSYRERKNPIVCLRFASHTNARVVEFGFVRSFDLSFRIQLILRLDSVFTND